MTAATTATSVNLLAPVTGLLVPLEHVPDPVFAQRVVGDGVSIDPLDGVLVAPIAGEVTDVQPSAHAVSLRSEEGLEVLMHIGLDTVKMQGEGFTPRVRAGQRVAAGDVLVEFDLDVVVTHAKSALTQMVILNSDVLESLTPRTGLVTAGADVVAELRLVDPSQESAATGGRSVTSEAILLPNPTGLHARPAATLVALAKGFSSEVRLRHGDDSANAKSIMAVMALGVGHGEKVTVTAHGPDAEDAVAQIARAIHDGLGEDCPPLAPGGPDTAPTPAVSDQAAAYGAPEPDGDLPSPAGVGGDPHLLVGVGASPGLAIGTVVQLRRHDIDVEEVGEDHHKERRKLNTAIDRALLDLSALQERLEKEGDVTRAQIFAAHAVILGDPELLDLAVSAIDKGKSAPYSWRAAFTTYADRLAALPNEVLAGRATDVRDVGQRVLEVLTGQRSEETQLVEGTVLVAEDMTPSDTARLDRDKVVGFVTTGGGASSHVALIARSLDLPAVVGIDGRALAVSDGERVVLDGGAGTLRLGLSEAELEDAKARQARIAQRRAADAEHQDEPAVTTDGQRVEVLANIGGVEDARQAGRSGGEGVGLLRSEFVFLQRTKAPTEDEQAQVYRECAEALAPGQPLVIRTLDVGGDKPLPYLPIPKEENPFLGIRGIRVGLERPSLLREQCRAILRAADAGARLHVMFPMIATIEDWRAVKRIWDEEAAGVAAGEHRVSTGIMMEVPSVAVMARQFAAEEGCDFFSVGTNDLTSYALAMDRGHPKLAGQVDPCNPSVLMLIQNAAQALHERGKWLGVCGGLASDVQAVPILLGLGVDELSCSIPSIPSVKARIRAFSRAQCDELAAKAVACSTPAEVRALVPMDEA